LPQIELLAYQPLELEYRKVLLIGRTIFLLIMAGILIAFIFTAPSELKIKEYTFVAIALFLIYTLWTYVATYKRFAFKSYALREKDIVYKTGWLWRQVTTVPFNRVQHVSIDQGPIERNFNLSKLKIYTAGGSASDITIPGLRPETADFLKEFIVKKTQDEEE